MCWYARCCSHSQHSAAQHSTAQLVVCVVYRCHTFRVRSVVDTPWTKGKHGGSIPLPGNSMCVETKPLVVVVGDGDNDDDVQQLYSHAHTFSIRMLNDGWKTVRINTTTWYDNTYEIRIYFTSCARRYIFIYFLCQSRYIPTTPYFNCAFGSNYFPKQYYFFFIPSILKLKCLTRVLLCFLSAYVCLCAYGLVEYVGDVLSTHCLTPPCGPLASFFAHSLASSYQRYILRTY